MQQQIKENRNNSKRYKKESLKKNRKKINDNSTTSAKKKLFKVKIAKNSDLYGDSTETGYHPVLVVAVEPKTNNVGVATISSIEDDEGNPTKQRQIKKGFIFSLSTDKTKNFNKKNGIKQEVIVENRTTKIKINHSMLLENKYDSSINEELMSEISDFLFNNKIHKKPSNLNNNKTKGYIKIK